MVVMTDESLKTQVLAQLRWDDRVKTSDVGVTVHNGIVTLMGTVPTYQAKQAAEEAAWRVRGITMIRNQLDVQRPTTIKIPSDNEIAANAETVLALDSTLDETKIDVDVSDGIVVLQGTVDAYWKKFQAERQVYNLQGVVDVVNELAIVPNHSIDDEVIAMDIEDALERSIGINVDDITVTVENGQVTLSGRVPNQAMRQAIIDIVSFTSGVTQVIDSLTISPDEAA